MDKLEHGDAVKRRETGISPRTSPMPVGHIQLRSIEVTCFGAEGHGGGKCSRCRETGQHLLYCWRYQKMEVVGRDKCRIDQPEGYPDTQVRVLPLAINQRGSRHYGAKG